SLTSVVFDKTGTLTLGEHRVVAQHTIDGMTDVDALRLAAALEQDAEHPIARAIVASAEERRIQVPRSENFHAIPGFGVTGRVEGRKLSAGGPNLVQQEGVEASQAFRDFARDAAARGQATIYLIEGKRMLAAFAVADAVRPESAEAVRRLHDAGIEV